MTEEILQFIWQYKQFTAQNLHTESGALITISKIGTLNYTDGPDFTNAQLFIGPTKLIGSIEIDLLGKNWVLHQHHLNPKFNNVILQVVWESPQAEIKNANGQTVEVLNLKPFVMNSVIENINQLVTSKSNIPCKALISNIPTFYVQSMLEKVTIERLTRKSAHILELLQLNKGDWEQTCYQSIMAYIAGPKNKDAFIAITQVLPFKLLLKYQNEILKLEALLLGSAPNILNSPHQYARQLFKEYQYLQKLHRLEQSTIPVNFKQCRPSGFPTLRLAQMAQLIHEYGTLFQTVKDLLALPIPKQPHSQHWFTHFGFSGVSQKRAKPIGASTQNVIQINAIAPLLFAYGSHLQDEDWQDKAVDLLTDVKPEQNHIIKRWKNSTIHVQSAFETQGLIELHQNYCTQYKCLQCRIGHKIMVS